MCWGPESLVSHGLGEDTGSWEWEERRHTDFKVDAMISILLTIRKALT